MWVHLLSCAKIGEKRLRRNFEEQFGTTLPRFDVMAALYRAPEGLRMGELSRTLLVSNGNVTSIVRQLQAQGFVRSVIDPNDTRSAIVSLTQEGQERFKLLAEAHHKWIADAFRGFPAERMEALVDLLSGLKSTLMRND
ncbi:MarR family winged helix-turn-helix transcriptional regulator [Sphingobium cloacae]|uniref:MarR family transcriptional regulator n=1 Tax=Sphingobium cloacae TaxID=120107 RepID=A0A1E1EYM0_9SPHN|nr:MarR family transcriptional regulator [Sphingobium cloacae]BAV63366.1 MarR family transcriptional regulator [Sphingobium cloacae]